MGARAAELPLRSGAVRRAAGGRLDRAERLRAPGGDTGSARSVAARGLRMRRAGDGRGRAPRFRPAVPVARRPVSGRCLHIEGRRREGLRLKIGAFETDVLMEITARPPAVFAEGKGSWLIDHRGKHYLDFVQGWAVNCLGHCPPEIVKTIAAQAKRLINPSAAFFNDAAIGLAQRLSRLSGL